MRQPLAMDPTQGVLADVELPGIVADDDRLVQEPVLGHLTPRRRDLGFQLGARQTRQVGGR
jgi:hypothetical protein